MDQVLSSLAKSAHGASWSEPQDARDHLPHPTGEYRPSATRARAEVRVQSPGNRRAGPRACSLATALHPHPPAEPLRRAGEQGYTGVLHPDRCLELHLREVCLPLNTPTADGPPIATVLLHGE